MHVMDLVQICNIFLRYDAEIGWLRFFCRTALIILLKGSDNFTGQL